MDDRMTELTVPTRIGQFEDGRLPYRFWEKVEPEPNSGCWLWTAGTSHGYGSISWHGLNGAHRIFFYTLTTNTPSNGIHIDHLCRTRCCVNPRHMEAVEPRINTLRGEGPTAKNNRKTHCDNGHSFGGTNLYIRTDGARRCRTCQRKLTMAYAATTIGRERQLERERRKRERTVS